MFLKKIVFFTCFLSLVIAVACPELYIVKEVGEKNAPLEEKDWDNYNGETGIYSILQKYQWPMNTASKITAEDRRKVLADEPDAERIFIEKKIQETFPGKKYKVVFIPTVVYELFAILMMLQPSYGLWQTIGKKFFTKDDFENFRNFFKENAESFFTGNVNELLYLAFMIGENFGEFPGFGSTRIDKKIKRAMYNKDKKKRKDIVAEIHTLYTNVNNYEDSKKVHFLLNWYISDQMIKYNNKNKNFHEIAGDVITRIDALRCKDKILRKNGINSSAQAIKIRDQDTYCLDLSMLKKNEISEDGALKKDGIIARTIDLEELVRKENQALLFRGTGVFEKVGEFEKTPFNEKLKELETKKTTHIASSLRVQEVKDPLSFNEIVKAYKEYVFHPFSISFGVSLFAGFFSDRSATAYNCMCNAADTYGYALKIRKIDYYIASFGHRNDLFFIPPLSTLSSLFARYEFFHARGKACIPGNPLEYKKNIIELLGVYGSDHSGLFLIQRDPLKHEKLFSNFVADNAVIIKSGNIETLLPVEQKALKEVQEESAKFYGAIATMKTAPKTLVERLEEKKKLGKWEKPAKGAWKPIASKVRKLEKRYKIYGNVGGKVDYEKTENHFSFYDTKAFLSDASYNDLDWPADENETVRKKLCTPKTLPPDKASNSFRIMSFNVHNFHRICGPNGDLRKNPDYACATIKTLSPDIALLQEIVPYAKTLKEAVRHNQHGPIDVDFTYLDKRMGGQGFVENIKVNDFQFTRPGVFMGKAIYTKNSIKTLDFDSGVLNEEALDRGYLQVLFTYPNSAEQILLYTVHLSYGNHEFTKKEIEDLCIIINQEMSTHKTQNVIVMGDFNTSPYPHQNENEKKEKKAIFNALEKNKFTLLNDPTPSAFTQNHSGILLDLAWVSPGFLEKFEIKNAPGEKGKKYKLVFPSDASDHWPIYIDFELKKKEDSLSKALSLLKAKLLQLAKRLKKK